MKKYLNNSFDSDKVARFLDETPIWSAPFGFKLLNNIDYRKNLEVLDIGSGCGFPLTELAMRLGDTSLVYGIDTWKAAMDIARQKIDFYQITNVKLIDGSAESIPLQNDSIDLITSNNGINNVSDIATTLSECNRVLKSGGQFIQTMNLDQSMYEFYQVLEDVLQQMGFSDRIDAIRKHILHKRPSVDKMKELLLNSDFVIKKIEYDQFNYRFADGSALLNHYFIRVAFMDSWFSLIPDGEIENVFNEIELRLNNYADKYGNCKLSIPYLLIEATKN